MPLKMPLGHGKFALCERYRLGKALRNQYDMAIVVTKLVEVSLYSRLCKVAVRRGWKGKVVISCLTIYAITNVDYPMMVATLCSVSLWSKMPGT